MRFLLHSDYKIKFNSFFMYASAMNSATVLHNLLDSKFVQNGSDIYDGGDRDLALQFPDFF